MKMGEFKNKRALLILALLGTVSAFLFFRVTFGLLFILINGLIIYVLVVLRLRKRLWAYRLIGAAYLIFVGTFAGVEGYILKEADETGNLSDDYGAVLILGAGLKGEEPSKTLLSRLATGVEILKIREDLPVVVSGGQGPGESISEAKAMGRHLVAHGIDGSRIIYEDESTNTYENMLFSLRVLEDRGLKEGKVLIVTNDFHLARSKILARDVGLDASGYAAPTPWFVRANYYIREYFAMVKTFLLGRGTLDG
ncbi:YdcF family protein [Rossellomorea sp. RS05]|uniref:YdcF family protein n=1 Tax=Rossellomorea sp. RS05 TaxID=3149166 RepID=UPI0032218A57